MKTFVGIFFVLAVMATSVSSLAAPSGNAYKNANDNASFKDGGKHDSDDSLSDKLKDRWEELDDDDDSSDYKKNKGNKKSGKK